MNRNSKLNSLSQKLTKQGIAHKLDLAVHPDLMNDELIIAPRMVTNHQIIVYLPRRGRLYSVVLRLGSVYIFGGKRKFTNQKDTLKEIKQLLTTNPDID